MGCWWRPNWKGVTKVHIACNAGESAQGDFAVAIGSHAGNSRQQTAIAIGYFAGTADQANNAIAIGTNAGEVSCWRWIKMQELLHIACTKQALDKSRY